MLSSTGKCERTLVHYSASTSSWRFIIINSSVGAKCGISWLYSVKKKHAVMGIFMSSQAPMDAKNAKGMPFKMYGAFCFSTFPCFGGSKFLKYGKLLHAHNWIKQVSSLLPGHPLLKLFANTCHFATKVCHASWLFHSWIHQPKMHSVLLIRYHINL